MSRTRSIGLIAAALLVVTGTGVDPLQSLYRENRRGNEALEKGDPAEALRRYTEAQGLAPGDPRVLYNLGLALAASGENEKAEQLWRQAASLGEGSLRRDAWFNQGVMALGGQDAAGAVKAFSEALLVDPEDAEARRNLELALRTLQSQPPQQQQSQEGDEQQSEGEDQQQSQGSSGQQDQQQDQQQSDQQGDEQDSPQKSQPEQQQGQEQQDQRNEQQQPSEGQDQQSEPGNQQQSMDAGDGQEQSEKPGDELIERLLDELEKGEKEALRRALARRAEQATTKPESSGRTW